MDYLGDKMRIPEKPPQSNTSSFIAAIDRLSLTEDSYHEVYEKAQSEYLAWDKVKYLKLPVSIKPEDLWQKIKYDRAISSKVISFGPLFFRFNLFGTMQKELHEFDMQFGGTLVTGGQMDKSEQHRYLISSLMEEAITSSQIEGAVTTRKVAKEMLRQNRPPKNKSERMILNNYNTIQLIRERKEQPLTNDLLLLVQKTMTSQTMDNPEDEGRFRTNDDINVIDVTDGQVMHHPPSVKQLQYFLSSFISFFNDENENTFIHPIIKASILHFMIGFIHPFADGNGRTARALFNWYLLKKGYWLTEYLSISSIILRTRAQYARAFLYTETDDNDLTYFINYKIKTMRLAYSSLQLYLQRKLEEKKSSSKFLMSGGLNERQAQLLEELVNDPDKILTVKEVQLIFKISNQTALADLTGLEKIGWLKTSYPNKKKHIFYRSNKFAELLKEVSNTQ